MRRSGQPVLQGGNGAWNEPQAGLFLLLMPISITTEAPKRSAAFGSGTLDTVDTVITLKSVPTTRDVPDDGRIAAEIAEDPATKVVPSDRRKLVWLSVAVKMASVNKDVSGNCTGSVGLKAPGPKSPSGITTGEPLPISVSEPPRNVRKSVTGKSGGRANPPENRSPVKSKILQTSTPDMLLSLGIKTSNEIRPMLTVLQNATVGANSRTIDKNKTGLAQRGMMHPPPSPNVDGIRRGYCERTMGAEFHSSGILLILVCVNQNSRF